MPKTLTGVRPHSGLKEGDLLAAVELGSNSFHMVVARHMLGQLRIIEWKQIRQDAPALLTVTR